MPNCNCHRCGYALAGLGKDVCPECGADVSVAGFIAAEGRAVRRGRLIDRVAIAAAVACAMLVLQFDWRLALAGYLGSAAAASVWFTRDFRRRGIAYPVIPAAVVGALAAGMLAVVWLIVFGLFGRSPLS